MGLKQPPMKFISSHELQNDRDNAPDAKWLAALVRAGINYLKPFTYRRDEMRDGYVVQQDQD